MKKAMRIIVLLKNIPGVFSAESATAFVKLVNTRLNAPKFVTMMKETDEALSSSK